MKTADKLAAVAIVISFGSAFASTWVTLKVGSLVEAKQEQKVAERLLCEARESEGKHLLAMTNRSTQQPVEFLFMNLHSPNADGHSWRSATYGAQKFAVLETAYYALPEWLASQASSEMDVVMQWKSPDLDRVRVHNCYFRRYKSDSGYRFSVDHEEDELLPTIRIEGSYLPDKATVRQPLPDLK